MTTPHDGTTEAATGNGANGNQGEGVTDTGKAGVTSGAKGIEGDTVDMAKLQEIIADRNAKGESEKALKAKAKELEAQIKQLTPLANAESKRREDEKSELERSNDKIAQMQAQLDLAAAQVSEQNRKLEATNAGVAAPYLEVVSTMIQKAQAADENLDVTAYVEGLKESHSALFGAPVTPVAPVTPPANTSGGPQAATESQAQVDAQIAELERVLKEQGSFKGREWRTMMLGKIANLRYCPQKGG
jgi:DNA repair exonuclease SbcCD ATPase subunit